MGAQRNGLKVFSNFSSVVFQAIPFKVTSIKTLEVGWERYSLFYEKYDLLSVQGRCDTNLNQHIVVDVGVCCRRDR